MKEKKESTTASGREGSKGRRKLRMTKCVHGCTKRKNVSNTHVYIHTHTHRNEGSKNTRVIISAVFEALDYKHLILICCLLLREKKRGKERQREERDGGKLRDQRGVWGCGGVGGEKEGEAERNGGNEKEEEK